jgi:RNA polymerase sigma-70 factor (ECF subfamily)
MSENAVRLWMSDADLRTGVSQWTLIIERAVTGDLAAFEQLMSRTQHRVLSTARRILGDAADAEEATQEVFLRVYRFLDRFDRTKPFEPWLYRLTINVCNDIASRRPKLHNVVPPENCEPVATEISPDESLKLDEQRRLVQSALSGLPRKQRTAVVLRDLQGLTISEVAEVMKVSQATVRSHLCSARLRLKELIGKRLGRAL